MNDTPQALPAGPRDEAAIRHKIYSAVTAADDLLRRMLSGHAPTVAEIRDVRGLLAEWRLESA